MTVNMLRTLKPVRLSRRPSSAIDDPHRASTVSKTDRPAWDGYPRVHARRRIKHSSTDAASKQSSGQTKLIFISGTTSLGGERWNMTKAESSRKI